MFTFSPLKHGYADKHAVDIYKCLITLTFSNKTLFISLLYFQDKFIDMY